MVPVYRSEFHAGHPASARNPAEAKAKSERARGVKTRRVRLVASAYCHRRVGPSDAASVNRNQHTRPAFELGRRVDGLVRVEFPENRLLQDTPDT